MAHTSATDTLSRFTYGLDPVGNRTAMTTREGTVTYRYDALDRLTDACWSSTTCPGGAPAAPLACLACVGPPLPRPAASLSPPVGETYRTYTYDPVGNRLAEASDAGTTTYAYDAADRLTSLTPPGQAPIGHSFDANGNQTAAGADTFAWDHADRLTSATVGGVTESYTYAGDGTRLTAASGASTTHFAWDRAFGLPQLALERNGAGSLLRSYRYGLDLLSQTSGAATTWYHHDGLGSVVDLTEPMGASLAWSEYYPYGLVRQSGSAPGAPGIQPFAFTGEQLDPTSGLYHLRARQYDPAMGRFLSTDPLAPLLTDPYVASYVYVQNNPQRYVDPSGREGEDFLESLWHVARFVTNAPWTGLGVGASMATGSDYCEMKDELVIECYGNDLLVEGSAIAIGNSVTTELNERRYGNVPGLRAHENAHTTQWMIPGFAGLYVLGAAWSVVSTGDLFCGNPFERAAGPTPGYERCGWGK